MFQVSQEERTFSQFTPSSFFQPEEYEIPKLALLDDMVTLIKQNGGLDNLSKTVVIGAQHLLETTVTLFDAIIALGVDPKNIFLSGKCYSTALEIEEQAKKRGIHIMPNNKPRKPGDYQESCKNGLTQMWHGCLDEIRNKDIERIIILDDGFRCVETMPKIVALKYKVAAIEQTRAGLYSTDADLLLFPLIEVASSAVKKILEPPLIASAVMSRAKKLISDLKPDKTTIVFGIIGNGAIGYAMCRFLLSQGFAVIIYDENESAFRNITEKRFFRVSKTADVIADADIIFSCTGKDITADIDVLSIANRDKILISCTSEDKEFRSLLKTISQNSPIAIDALSDISCLTKHNTTVKIFGGGYPFNFDRSPWNVPAKDIEVTQGLLLGAFMQAVLCATKPIEDGTTINNRGGRQSLNPFIQKFIASHWLARQPKGRVAEKTTLFFDDIKWIQTNSGGTYVKEPIIYRCFNQGITAIDEPMPFIRYQSKL